MALSNKQIAIEWSDFRDAIKNSTPVNTSETAGERRKRIVALEKDFEKWVVYYFPKYSYATPADFHKKASKRILQHAEWFESRNWSRELAKSTRTMFEVLYLVLTGKKRYVLLTSNSETAAGNLLEPYRSQLDSNQRIINDYGLQESLGKWTWGAFSTRQGAAFKAIGAGQSPRGTRNEEVRPDVILVDDMDTDEDVRNPDIINKRWEWIENALIGTRSISQPTLIIFCGNIIAKDCCITRAHEYSDHVDVVNIRDAEARSTWPEKNSEEHIDRVLSQKSYLSQQREYFNNPIEQGTVFKEISWGACPPMRTVPFMISYGDPSPSNRDRPSQRSKAQNSCKAVVLVAPHNNKYYVYKAFVDITTNSTFVHWLYAMNDEVASRTPLYSFIENNGLQNPFYEQVLLPLIHETGKERGNVLGVTPDDRDKPDKFFRIEGTLEPLNRLGQLVFNEREKDCPHMKRLVAQLLGVAPNSKTMDGPDALEGAVHAAKNKIAIVAAGGIESLPRIPNNKRY